MGRFNVDFHMFFSVLAFFPRARNQCSAYKNPTRAAGAAILAYQFHGRSNPAHHMYQKANPINAAAPKRSYLHATKVAASNTKDGTRCMKSAMASSIPRYSPKT